MGLVDTLFKCLFNLFIVSNLLSFHAVIIKKIVWWFSLM